MTIRTLDFLPSIFRTSANQKFLNATVDQLVAEPNFKKINGYIGRKFAPTYKSTDNYLPEPTDVRQNYQLEPCTVISDSAKNINFFSSYSDLIQQVQHYSGLTNNHSRLFSNEAYSFDGLFDYDKLVNFSQYYWLPTGPATVDVFAGLVENVKDYTVIRNTATQNYEFTGHGSAPNPDIILSRGGVYQFTVNQPGAKFWIQTKPGTAGVSSENSNISLRDVYGVVDNGMDNGIVTFNVPQKDAQDFFANMPIVRPVDGDNSSFVDLATTVNFNEIDNQLIENFIAKIGGIDGIGDADILHGKYLIFVSNDVADPDWDEKGIYAFSAWGEGKYDEGELTAHAKRTGVWQIQIIDTGDSDQLINLSFIKDIPLNHKVIIRTGKQYANKEFYKNELEDLVEVPVLTAFMDTLYYNDGSDQRYFGKIRLVDNNNYKLDIPNEILGKTQYTSTNKVVFTNGLKIKFDTMVTPSDYADSVYYVDGVGTSIRLTKETDLITPELEFESTEIKFDIYGFDDDFFSQVLSGPLYPDYITINRSSLDCNAWSRSNRWFHSEIIELAAMYNETIPKFDQLQRASRPIIEFIPDLQLFNNGRIGRHNVDIIDFTVVDAFNEVEGDLGYVSYFNEAKFKDGMTVIFANDFDPTVRNKIYKVNLLEFTETQTNTFGDISTVLIQKVHLTEVQDGVILTQDSVIPKYGITVRLDDYPTTSDQALKLNPSVRKVSLDTGLGSLQLSTVLSDNLGLILGKTFWYNGTSWVQAQQKANINIAPKFDVIGTDFISFGDLTRYNTSSFTGCEIFSYKPGSGANDTILGFPLSYRNFNNVGDIEFNNLFDTDTFTELRNLATIPHKVNTGFAAKIIDRNTVEKKNIWAIKDEPTRQHQIISSICDGKTSYFEIDILPDSSTYIPNIRVYLNNRLLASSEYSIQHVGIRTAVLITASIVLGDKVDILIYSATQVSKLGYYEIPPNLDLNTLNSNFASLTLGQFRNHLTAIATNSTEVNGLVPGRSNLRDLDIKSRGGSILQHSAPAIYGSVFLVNKELNFIDSVSLAQLEYTRFKNQFLESFSAVVDAGITDAPSGIDFILRKLNEVKNSLSPWYYSDMVPYDQNRSIIKYEVLDVEINEYEIDTIFVDTTLSNKAILVYVNGEQLLKNIDFTFSQTRPSIVFMKPLNYNDTIEIKIFHNTDGSCIPETPTKLGLYPLYQPEIFLDETYQTPTTAIRGHDGSITPAFGDFRDGLLLELEQRIYNNIKLPYNPKNFNIFTHIPGKFRTTDYNKAEYDQILMRSFLNWVSNKQVDYSTNQWFQSNNPWSWTYNRFKDIISKDYLPGYWRGVYRYFYDTDAPNAKPWESLGFTQMPDWWIDTYGPAPYTGGNLVLWNDLENGIIRSGEFAGTYSQYARPGLSKVIPVNDSGELRSPQEFLVTAFNGSDVSNAFQFGDEGPVESSWRKSSDYPFAVQQAIALMKPGIYFGQLASIQHYYRDADLNQNLVETSKQRITPNDFVVNGDTTQSNNTISRNAGYLNWIADFIRSNGSDPSLKIYGALQNLEVRLGYRVAGFTDKSYLKVLAEQSSPSSVNESIMIPDENYTIHLHKSSPIDRVVYSAVVIEKTTSGYTVTGYSTNKPYFTIIPSEPNSNQRKISSAGATGIIYQNYQPVKVNIAYGTEFKNKQQVVDFLVSYGRYLEAQGFVFEDFHQTLQEIMGWELSAKEFLTWTQQGWGPGNVIVLSPVLNQIKLRYENAIVDEITNLPLGSKALDVGFNVIKNSMFNIVREGNNFEFTTLPEITVGLLDLSLVQYEHVIIFDNKTLFSDIIYKPELGNRQYRLKLIGNKTGGWFGQISSPGFVFNNPVTDQWATGQDYRKGDIVIYKNFLYAALQDLPAAESFNFGYWKQIDKNAIKTGLLPNFSYNAKKFENMYDIDNQISDQNLNVFGNGLTGYRERSYLTDLSLNSTSQAKFYQGYIRDKGTKDVVTALSTASFSNMTGSLSYYEEWAFRVGSYGATESNQFIEVQLSDNKYIYNPISLTILESGEASPDVEVIAESKPLLYKKPINAKTNIFSERDEATNYENDIKTAGYVNLNDIDITIFDIQDYKSLASLTSSIHSGNKLWVAKDLNKDWNVYRISESATRITSISYQLDGLMMLGFNSPHIFKINELFVIKGFASLVDGVYAVKRVDGAAQIVVEISAALESQLIQTPLIEGDGAIFTMHSARLNTLSDISNFTPEHNWVNDDRVWVDQDTVDRKWAVYQKSTPWNYDNEVMLKDTELKSGANFGASAVVSDDGLFVLVGAPNSSITGEVKVFVKTDTGYAESTPITLSKVVNFGFAIDTAKKTIAIGAPDSNDGRGKVAIFKINLSITGLDIKLSQVINLDLLLPPTPGVKDNFGYSVSLSRDEQWLYVGAPGSDKVFCFALEEQTLREKILTTDGTNLSFNLGTFVPHSAMSISVKTQGVYLSPVDDYAIDLINNQIVFPTVPAVGTYILTEDSYYDVIGTPLSASSGVILGDRFGHSIKTQFDGSMLVVGAPDSTHAGSATYSGSAYLFSRNGDAFHLGPFQEFKPTVLPYNARFGTAVTMSNSGKEIFVSAPRLNVAGYHGGEVYRYTHAGLTYNTVLGKIPVTTFSIGNKKLYINGTLIDLPSPSTPLALVGMINAAGIIGLAATLENGYLRLTFNAPTAIQNLSVTPYGDLDLLASHLGLDEAYEQTQILRHPYPSLAEQFGSKLVYDEEYKLLAAASEGAPSMENRVLDNGTTILDGKSTTLHDYLYNTGSVYLYEELKNEFSTISNPTAYGFIQQLSAPSISSGDNFGASIAIRGNAIFVGANHDTSGRSLSLGKVTITGNTVHGVDTKFLTLLHVNEKVQVNDVEFTITSIASHTSMTVTPTLTADQTIIEPAFMYRPDSGRVYWFSNPTYSKGWSKLRQQEGKVDLDSALRMYIYNSKTQDVLSHLDIIDPAKGKILGAADQDITYKTSYDPANYNTGFNPMVAIDPSFHWGTKQVGQVWWNLDKVRYLDYEQSNLTYRIKNWGRLFPGAEIEIMEWVSSDAPPSQYKADGIPKYVDDSAYVIASTVDQITGLIKTKYYFWVKNKASVPPVNFRRLSTISLTNLIASPNTQDVSYAAILRNNAVSLFNSTKYIAASSSILHIDYGLVHNSNIIHNEYELVQENYDTAALPTRIVDKLVDSLTGSDKFGKVVPDYTLSASERYGISIRPRQTMIVDRLSAIKNFVLYVNSVFKQYPVVEEFDLSKLTQAEEMPTIWDPTGHNVSVSIFEEKVFLDTSQMVVGQRILVKQDSNFDNQWSIYELQYDKTYTLVRTQTYRTNDYWSVVDWYDPTYDSTVKPTYTVGLTTDIAKITLAPNITIKVNNNGAGQFVVYRVNGDLTTSLVGVQNGTIQLSDALWAHDTNQIGFGNDSFDTVKYDLNPTTEFRNIIDAIRNDIFINNLDGHFNKLFFVMLNYILSEQRSIDWAFKTSFISIIHHLRKLEQFPNYIKDNQSFYENYIDEVKPYRTKIREYIINYQGLDLGQIHPTDFDLPSYYDTDYGLWRSPSGEHARDALLLTQNQYADWNVNHDYIIESVAVVDPGRGYYAPPNMVVVGGGGSGAKLTAVVDYYTGSITKVIVNNSGSGYTSTPTIQVLGDGVTDAGVQTCRCYPILRNSKVRTFDTTLKFDRVSYSSTVKQWTKNTAYTISDIVSYNSTAYRAKFNQAPSETFNPLNYQTVDPAALDSFALPIMNAADRTMAYYAPTVGMPPQDLRRLFSGIEYPGNKVDGRNFLADKNVELDTQIESYFKDVTLGIRPEDINIVGGAFIDTFSSHAPEEFLPGMIYDTLDIKVFTVDLNDPTNNPRGYRISKVMATDLRTTFDSNITQFDSTQTYFYEQPFIKNAWEFRRISVAATTTLVRDLNIDDTRIYVVNATKLPTPSPTSAHPGVIYINGEKITYYTVDLPTNSLGQLRRGVWGTGAPAKHIAGSMVVDASLDQLIPSNVDPVTHIVTPPESLTWLNPGDGVTIAVDGSGLFASQTDQAAFLKAQPSYLPWVPGSIGFFEDPNLHTTRFDDNGAGEYDAPVHAFDADPFDSYIPT